MNFRRLFSWPAILFLCSIVIAMLAGGTSAQAQQLPPRPMSVYVNPAQPLSFGAFFQGPNGGSVIIYPDGSRSVTGDVVQASLGYSFTPALFEIEALPGTLVSILNGPDVYLTGSNGGTMRLRLGTTSPATPFIVATTPPSRTVVTLGGTLFVGSPQNNPAGAYIGTFNVTFIQE